MKTRIERENFYHGPGLEPGPLVLRANANLVFNNENCFNYYVKIFIRVKRFTAN